jgi:hypothetical protein
MIDKPSTVNKIIKKRLPKGKRTHIRRLKQEANKPGTVQN